MVRRTMTGADRRTTDFGFEEVDVEDKQRLVNGVFRRVADRYDLMNDLMSLGLHRLWKTAMVDWLAPRPGMAFLDVGGGTGDIAFRIVERGCKPVTVVDVNQDMLAQGRARALDRGILEGIEWIVGDAEAPPAAPGRQVPPLSDPGIKTACAARRAVSP